MLGAATDFNAENGCPGISAGPVPTWRLSFMANPANRHAMKHSARSVGRYCTAALRNLTPATVEWRVVTVVDAEITSAPSALQPFAVATDYLGLTPEQRYAVISEKFPVWLLAEPIEPSQGTISPKWVGLSCAGMRGGANRTCSCSSCVLSVTPISAVQRSKRGRSAAEEFLGQAKPFHPCWDGGSEGGPAAESVKTTSEARRLGHCRYHVKNLDHAGDSCRRGFNEKTWRQTPTAIPAPSLPDLRDSAVCSRSKANTMRPMSLNSRPMCQVHYERWLKWLEISERDRYDDAAWTAWSAMAADDEYFQSRLAAGEVTCSPSARLVSSTRFATRSIATRKPRSVLHWRVLSTFRKVVSALAEAGIQSLSERAVAELQQRRQGTGESDASRYGCCRWQPAASVFQQRNG